MRALSKKASQYFEKKEKPTEDIETKMNKLQAKIISKYIGIDEQEIGQFDEFFDQIVKMKLPKGYKRYINSDKTKIIYVNEETNQQDSAHPNLDIIKVAFYQILTDASKVYTFGIKSRKLLGFVEEKMAKQCIGLSSKRRDAQKNNIQRDQNGKMVISKLARIKPDLRALISARSYMLKALVQKIYTKRELWGKGKRTNAFAAILASEKRNSNALQELNDQQEESQETLELYEKIFIDSRNFYMKQYGNLLYIPEELKLTKEYYKSTPESVTRNIQILNIEKSSLELYWLARLMQCLPLPPKWSRKFGDSFDRFFYEPNKLYFDIHPSYIYIVEQITIFKQFYNKMDIIHQNYYNNMKQMVFFDFFERPYDVDLYGFLEINSEMPMTKKKALKKSYELGKNDWMALEGIKNSELKVENYVLIEDILQYWGTLNIKQDNYTPAISPFGQVIWSSTINQKTIHFCPHSEILKVLMARKSLQMPKIEQKDIKCDQEGEQNEIMQLYESLKFKRQNFLQHYIRNDPKPLSQPYQIPSQYTQNQFFDSIFLNPFDLESDLKFDQSTEKPLWLQKVHAKRNKDLFYTLLNQSSSNFQSIKEKFSEYALKMIRKHEADREEDITNILSQISNVSELKKFINHINDIDAREQRKKLQVEEEEEERVSLGSSISQIQVDEMESQEESSEDELFEVQPQQREQTENIDENAQDKGNKSDISAQESKKIEEVSQQSDIQQRVPEKYVGIIYEKDNQLQKLTQSQLQTKIKELKNKKILKYKYSKQNIKEMVNKFSQDMLQDGVDEETLINRKRNLIISGFNSEHSPYKTSPDRIKRKSKVTTTALHIYEVSHDFSAFKSETSELGNENIIENIRKIQSINEQKRKEQQEYESLHKKNAVDDTKQTIQLMPIKRIKPDINEDPMLMHISQLKNPEKFRKTFNNFNKVNSAETKERQQKNQKDSLQETRGSSKFYPDKTHRSLSSNRKSVSISKLESSSNLRMQKTKQEFRENYGDDKTKQLRKTHSVLSLSHSSLSPNKLTSKFNRVCLGNIATCLLGTQPVLRKGDLIVIEARKSLIAKNRGLETLISKKY